MNNKENEKINDELDRIIEQVEPEEEEQNNEEEVACEGEEPKTDAEIEKLKKQYDELNERYLRLYADFENYKKRSVRDKADALVYAASPLVEKLLSVKDNFERALETNDDGTPLYEGVKMVAKQFSDILSGEGLSEIKAKGEAFDPNCHNAVMTENDPDTDDNVVTEELQKGYTFKDKIIRPSMVKVNKHQ